MVNNHFHLSCLVWTALQDMSGSSPAILRGKHESNKLSGLLESLEKKGKLPQPRRQTEQNQSRRECRKGSPPEKTRRSHGKLCTHVSDHTIPAASPPGQSEAVEIEDCVSPRPPERWDALLAAARREQSLQVEDRVRARTLARHGAVLGDVAAADAAVFEVHAADPALHRRGRRRLRRLGGRRGSGAGRASAGSPATSEPNACAAGTEGPNAPARLASAPPAPPTGLTARRGMRGNGCQQHRCHCFCNGPPTSSRTRLNSTP